MAKGRGGRQAGKGEGREAVKRGRTKKRSTGVIVLAPWPFEEKTTPSDRRRNVQRGEIKTRVLPNGEREAGRRSFLP